MKATTTAAAKFKTVDEYQSSLPANTKNIFKQLRKIVNDAAPGAEETISYNIPCLKFHGGLIWFAMWKEHFSLYPKSARMATAIPELSAYDGAKGTIKFPLDQPIPAKLITKVIKFRIQENLEEKKLKA
jgi:uncharacterized protein YdhG (YjbR/CyaY superfamily)